KPEEYWSINAQFLKGKDTFQGKFYGIKGKKKELKNEKSVKEIIDQLTEEQFTIDKVNKRERKRNPAKPFITSSLQQEAARKLACRGRQTMSVARELYDCIDIGRRAGSSTGFITYMRPDSTRISERAKAEASPEITDHYGEQYFGAKTKNKNQE